MRFVDGNSRRVVVVAVAVAMAVFSSADAGICREVYKQQNSLEETLLSLHVLNESQLA